MELIVRRIPQRDSIRIYPIADVHLGSLLHDKESWNAFCRRVEQEDAFLILGGDLINNNTRHAAGSPFEDYIRPREQKKLMVEMLTPIKEKILCAVGGNHEARTAKDTDQDIMGDIMCKLDLEDSYAEDLAFLKLEIGQRITRSSPITTYTFAVTHGTGGGIYTGAAVNRNERFGYTIEGGCRGFLMALMFSSFGSASASRRGYAKHFRRLFQPQQRGSKQHHQIRQGRQPGCYAHRGQHGAADAAGILRCKEKPPWADAVRRCHGYRP